MTITEPKAFNPVEAGIIYKKEVLLVKELGEQIGYGNLMDIASILWNIANINSHGIEEMCHVSVSMPMLLKKERVWMSNALKEKTALYKAFIQ